MIKKIALYISGSVLFILLVTFATYSFSRADRLERLRSGSRLADTPLGQVEYRIIGGSGPFLLYFHAVLSGYDTAVIPPPGVRIIIPSRPGYLGTSIESGRSVEEQANVMAALLDALNIESVVAYGTAAGAAFAITFASMFPDRTDGLITYAAVTERTNIPGDLEAPIAFRSEFVSWSLFSLFTAIRGPEGIVKSIVTDTVSQQRAMADPEILTALTSFAWGIWPFSLREAGWRNDNDVLNNLDLPVSSLAVPTLILHGTADINVPFENSARLADEIYDSQLYAISGGNHLARLSHWEELNTVVLEFMNSLRTTPMPAL